MGFLLPLFLCLLPVCQHIVGSDMCIHATPIASLWKSHEVFPFSLTLVLAYTAGYILRLTSPDELDRIDSVGGQGSFGKNLAEFAEKGFISQRQREILEVVLEAGHATMHRAYQPSNADLGTCVDIAENVLQTVCVHPEKAAELKERVPKRK